MLWDMYQLKAGVEQLAEGGGEGAAQIREIANQLEDGLREFEAKNEDRFEEDLGPKRDTTSMTAEQTETEEKMGVSFIK